MDVVVDFLKDVDFVNGCLIDIIKLIKINYYNIVFFLFFGEKFKFGDEILSCFVELVDEVIYIVLD